MPLGTAANRLRKSLLFNFAKRLNLDNCFRCNQKILSEDDFSIEHKEFWLDTKSPIELYFSLDNIAFSHELCNYKCRRMTWKKAKEGEKWCRKCQLSLSLDKFYPSQKDNLCKEHNKQNARERKAAKRGIHVK